MGKKQVRENIRDMKSHVNRLNKQIEFWKKFVELLNTATDDDKAEMMICIRSELSS